MCRAGLLGADGTERWPDRSGTGVCVGGVGLRSIRWLQRTSRSDRASRQYHQMRMGWGLRSCLGSRAGLQGPEQAGGGLRAAGSVAHDGRRSGPVAKRQQLRLRQQQQRVGVLVMQGQQHGLRLEAGSPSEEVRADSAESCGCRNDSRRAERRTGRQRADAATDDQGCTLEVQVEALAAGGRRS